MTGGDTVTNAAASEPILELRGLRKTFPGVVALDGVDFDVRPGEVHALLGANGAGKSTLIKIVAGLYHADEGEIRIGGRPVELRDTQTARALGVSVIYQDFALAPNLSVAENLFLGVNSPRLMALIDWQRTDAEARRLLDRLGIDIPTTAKCRAPASATASSLKLLKALEHRREAALDEPTACVSRGETEKLFGLIRQLTHSGVGIVYVSRSARGNRSARQSGDGASRCRSVGTYRVRSWIEPTWSP